MNDDSIRQGVLFSDLYPQPLVAKFDQHHGSSDGGAILLKAADRHLGLSEGLIGAIEDRRQGGKVRHAIAELLHQRLYAIACGYPDGNDAARLSSDPIQKLLCDRDPVRGVDLASQTTLSRFENAVRGADLYRMDVALSEPATRGALGILSRLLPRLRTAFPRARLRVRLDGGFAAPAARKARPFAISTRPWSPRSSGPGPAMSRGTRCGKRRPRAGSTTCACAADWR